MSHALRRWILTAFSFVTAAIFPMLVLAEEAVKAPAEAAAGNNSAGLTALATAIAISVAAAGGALAQGKTAVAALEGIGRNPSASGKFLTPMILGMALIESLVIYALIIAFVLAGKI